MDTHGLTWTNTLIHARPGMNKVRVGPCGSMAKKFGVRFRVHGIRCAVYGSGCAVC